MSEEEKEEEEQNIDLERKKLEKMGVNSTWDILSSKEKKKKEQEKKPSFRGFN
ncbi:MAG: hypothetical protein ACFFHD_07960 [Promethearchaeota archaeon]